MNPVQIKSIEFTLVPLVPMTDNQLRGHKGRIRRMLNTIQLLQNADIISHDIDKHLAQYLKTNHLYASFITIQSEKHEL